MKEIQITEGRIGGNLLFLIFFAHSIETTSDSGPRERRQSLGGLDCIENPLFITNRILLHWTLICLRLEERFKNSPKSAIRPSSFPFNRSTDPLT